MLTIPTFLSQMYVEKAPEIPKDHPQWKSIDEIIESSGDSEVGDVVTDDDGEDVKED